MSEYELLESFTSFQGLLQGWITAGYSGTIAYLVAAYMAGSKLTRSQVVVVNLVYIVYSSLCLVSAHGNYARMLELAAEVQLLNPERAFSEPPRLSRRLHSLRGWSNGNTEQVFSRGSGARGEPGARAAA